MLNFRFIKSQFKTVWIVILCFAMAFLAVIAFAAIFPSLGDGASTTIIKEEGRYENSSSGWGGASMWINGGVFGIGSTVIFLAFGIAMSILLINKDINRGYIASWMTTSMSRPTIFNSKLFVLITSTLFLNIWIIIVEMIVCGLRMSDFNQAIGQLLFGNFILILFSLMIVAGCWMVFSIFNKTSIALGILLGLGGWFVLCAILVMLSADPSLAGLKYFKYFTIQSLFNSPLKFDKLPDEASNWPGPGTKTWIAEILPLKAKDYAWQLPIIGVSAVGLFIGAQFIIKSKDFAF